MSRRSWWRGTRRVWSRCIANLLSNAVKYSPAGGLVEVVRPARGRPAILEVVDQGIGVPEDERDQLFAPFSRTPTRRSTPGSRGPGSGLYISRRIVEAHGGSIELRDTPGGGATFRVTLPLPAVGGWRGEG